MAKELLDAIRKAENECKERESVARQNAAAVTDKSKKDAAKLIEGARANAELNAEKAYEAARAQGEAELEKAISDAERQCAEISEAAERNRSAVIEKAMAAILD